MNKVREIIRIHEQSKLSQRAIARALHISRPVVSEYLKKIKSSGLTYAAIQKMDDDTLMEILDSRLVDTSERFRILKARFPDMAKELKRTGVTLLRLWEEYRQDDPDGYSYSQFCYHFQVWRDASETTMHIEHKAGDKMFADFAGKKLQILNRSTGELIDVEVFVAILGASGYTYVEATATQKKHDWIKANQNALYFFGGVPTAIVPDCLKTAVTKPDKYEPDINPEYAYFARHYQTTILPARPGHAKDKALVESAVKIAYIRIYAAIRNRIFYSLTELNQAIREELENHNNKPMQRLGKSRKQLFLDIEHAALKPLPAQKYQNPYFKKLKVQFNYHIFLNEDKHYYSVPYRISHQNVWVIYTDSWVEIFYKNTRVASHPRSRLPGKYSTHPEHMPPNHRAYGNWNPDRLIRWARKLGEHVEMVITKTLETRAHPEQAYKTCLGILNLEKQYDTDRLNRACLRAASFGLYSYKGIRSILEKKIEDQQMDTFEPLPDHANIRGSRYYS